MMMVIGVLIGCAIGYAVASAVLKKKKEPFPRALPPQPVSAPHDSACLEDKLWYEGQLAFLLNFDKKLISASSLQDVMHCIVDAAYTVLPIDHAVFLTWDKKIEKLTVACAMGWNQGNVRGLPLIDKESIAGFVIRNRGVLVIPDLAKDPYLMKLNKEEYLQKTFISAPLVYKEEALGVLHVCGKRTGPFTQRDVSVITNMVNMGATSLENALLYEETLKRAKELKIAYDELKEMQDKLIQSEKLKAIGQLASGVAHEMRNPLGIIMQGVAYLEQITPVEAEEPRHTLSVIKDSARRADGIVISLLDFSRATKLDLRAESINSILEESLTLIKTELKDIKVSRQIQEGLPKVLADKNKLMQVMINLMVNAVHAMPQGGELVIRGSVQPEDKNVIVEIEDNGTGIPEENLKKIFDPFFTTKGPGKGTGLGLSICRNIIALHNGQIDIKSRQNQGTKVVITLTALKEGETDG